jgi:hypothetical protein
MSNIFQYLARKTGGAIPLNIGVGALVDPIKSQGLNVDAVGAVYAVLDGVAVDYHSALSFDANGRLIVSNGAVTHTDQAIPFTATGMAVELAPVDYVSQGLGYTATGKIANTSGVPPAVVDFNQADFNPQDFA